jgi:protein-S-isoprenylcysteine O-methyltransferase Ste14
MQRLWASIGSAIFLVIAPGTFGGLIPWLISRWRFEPPLLDWPPMRWLGVLAIAAGLPILLDSFGRFALQGLGTPAPIAPPRRLVVTGLYRFVRNPMYVAVLSLIFGQGLLFGNLTVLRYGLGTWVSFHLFVFFYEEPTLRGKFGAEYERYFGAVGRWLPRVTPWRAPT